MAQESANALTDFSPNLTMGTQPVQQPGVDVVAKPTPIRFSVPAMPKDTGLEDLARGLGQFDSAIGGYLKQRDDKQAQADALQAQADFQRNHGQGYADAVAAGVIPAQASDAYVNAYKESQGTLAGQQLEAKFQQAYDLWPGKGVVDDGGAGYQKFVQDFMAKNVGTNDPAVLKGLLPVLHEVATHGMRQHIVDVNDTVKQGFSDTQSATVNNGIAAAVGYANTSGNPVDPSYIAGVVGDAYSKARAVGVTDEQAQKNAITQITTAALLNKAHHGDEILRSLDIPLPGTNLTLSQTPFGAEQKVKVQNELDAYGRQVELQSQRKLTQENKVALGTVESRVLTSLSQDPTKPVSEQDLVEGQKYDPTFREKVMKWQKGFTEAGAISDPQGLINLHRDIMNGGGPDAVANAMDTGVIKNIRDLQEAQKAVEEHAKAAPVMANLTSSEPYKSVIATIKQQTSATGAVDPFGSSGMSPAGLGLQYELNKQMQEWGAANPGATNAQTQEQFAKVSAGILKLITVPASKETPAGPVQLPQGNPYANPQMQPTPTPQQPQSGATKPSPSSSPNSTGTTGSNAAPAASSPQDPAKVKAWVDSLPPEQQQNLAKAVLRTGKPVEQVSAEAYGHALAKGLIPGAMPPQTPGATPNAGSTGASPFGNIQTEGLPKAALQFQPGAAEQFGDAIAKWRASDPNAEATIHQLAGVLTGIHASLPYQGSTTLAAIKDNPQAAKLLDFVSGPESGGNYNAYFGHANSTKDLSGMTLNEILQFQHDLVHVQGLPSSATGRYQFMPATLQGLMSQMHLTGNERFTPEMQDNLALQLLKNRGLEQWQKGQLSDAAFMNNLAYEWASLPNPHTGMSQYHGDGLNKSLVTPGQVQGVLNGARGLASGETPAAPAAPAPSAPAAIAPPTTDDARADPEQAVYYGDSIGHIAQMSAHSTLGNVKDGRSPADTFEAIKADTKTPVAGRTVVLSAASNNVNDLDSVAKSIDLLIKRGATPADIRLVGVGDFAAAKNANLNAKLQELADRKGVTFTGPLDVKNLRPDRVHPAVGSEYQFLKSVFAAKRAPDVTKRIDTAQASQEDDSSE